MTTEQDIRLAPLAPSEADDAAERYLASLGSERSRLTQRQHLERLAPIIARIPHAAHRPFHRRLKARLSAVPWHLVDAKLCAHALARVLDQTPTLRAAGAVLQPLRGTLRVAMRDRPGQLFLCLEALRVDGQGAERAEQTFWFDQDDPSAANDAVNDSR